LKESGYSHSFATGQNKKHGCAVLYKCDAFSKVDELVINYDDYRLRESFGVEGSFLTRNIALIVALKPNFVTKCEGLIVATTHLFWHPK